MITVKLYLLYDHLVSDFSSNVCRSSFQLVGVPRPPSNSQRPQFSHSSSSHQGCSSCFLSKLTKNAFPCSLNLLGNLLKYYVTAKKWKSILEKIQIWHHQSLECSRWSEFYCCNNVSTLWGQQLKWCTNLKNGHTLLRNYIISYWTHIHVAIFWFNWLVLVLINFIVDYSASNNSDNYCLICTVQFLHSGADPELQI